MQWLLVLFSSLLGAAVLGSYVVVLGNVGDRFPLPPARAPANATTYFDNPYWLGVPTDAAAGVTALQLAAAAGYVTWFVWLVTSPVDTGLLQGAGARVALLGGFLLGSTLWPYAAHAQLCHPGSVGRALVSCLCLWVAAVCVILLIGGTFEARAPAAPTVGILLLGQVVVLADGVGWTAVALHGALYPA